MANPFQNVMSNIFGQRPVQQAMTQAMQPQQQVSPGNIPQNPQVTVDPNNPTLPNSDTNQSAAGSPMGEFAKLFDTDPNAKSNTPVSTFANLDPKAIAEASKTNDFRNVVTKDMQASILKGGPEAVNAMMEAMNSMAQKSFGDSAIASTKLIDKALADQRKQFEAALPGIIKSQTSGETLRAADPLFSNPAVAPMINMVKSQVAAKYPDASSAEQAKMVQDYVKQFAEAATPQKKVTPGTDPLGNKTDWSEFLDD